MRRPTGNACFEAPLRGSPRHEEDGVFHVGHALPARIWSQPPSILRCSPRQRRASKDTPPLILLQPWSLLARRMMAEGLPPGRSCPRTRASSIPKASVAKDRSRIPTCRSVKEAVSTPIFSPLPPRLGFRHSGESRNPSQTATPSPTQIATTVMDPGFRRGDGGVMASKTGDRTATGASGGPATSIRPRRAKRESHQSLRRLFSEINSSAPRRGGRLQ
jgi:hypothetical protein